jgi:hypothetical protein
VWVTKSVVSIGLSDEGREFLPWTKRMEPPCKRRLVIAQPRCTLNDDVSNGEVAPVDSVEDTPHAVPGVLDGMSMG